MRNQRLSAGVLLCASLTAAGPGLAADLERGERVFKRCAACHSLTADGSQENGPTLYQVFGRQAGAAPGYELYSEPMTASGIVWTEETMDAFLAKPKQVVENNTMNFSALRKKADRTNLIAYLLEATK